jgi:hypothetical protein
MLSVCFKVFYSFTFQAENGRNHVTGPKMRTRTRASPRKLQTTLTKIQIVYPPSNEKKRFNRLSGRVFKISGQKRGLSGKKRIGKLTISQRQKHFGQVQRT